MTNKIMFEGEIFKKNNYRAGYDIVQDKEIKILPFSRVKIKTNVRFPNGLNGNFALITLRSSYQTSGLIMPSTGIIDEDYKNYVFITVVNVTNEEIIIEKGDRIAQLIFIPNNFIDLNQRSN